MSYKLVEKMKQGGVIIEWYRPLLRWKIWKSDHRTHRKILVCDRKVAFTGGVGIADEWDGDAKDPSQWRDTHFKIEGPAVGSIFSGFVENWVECGRRISELHDFKHTTRKDRRGKSAIQVIRSPAAYGWTDFTTVLRLLISIAKKHINITTAYFNPDKATVELLQDAANRGVKVNILVPGLYTDQKIAKIAGEAKYEALIGAGIRIMHYQRTMLHAKIFSVDGLLACIGSPNFNQRSMRKDDELGMVVFDPEIIEILDAHFGYDLQASDEIDSLRWGKKRKWKEDYRIDC
jgi:cardiolipin synthase